MDILSKIKEVLGQDFNELQPDEKEVVMQWQKAIEERKLSIDQIKDFILDLKNAVIKDLIKTPEYDRILFIKIPNRKHLYLKARLENLVIMEEFLFGTDKINKAITNYLETINKK